MESCYQERSQVHPPVSSVAHGCSLLLRRLSMEWKLPEVSSGIHRQKLGLGSTQCAFDYRGSWDTSATGAHAALYDPNSNISTSYGLTSWVRAGVPGKMVVMGLPLYGRTWQLKDPKVNGIGAPATAVGPGDDGVLIFSEVEKFNRENGATVVYDAKTVSTYSHAGTSWIGYDDSRSTTVKLEFAQAHGLRGYFFWALSYDREWEISKQASRTWVTG
ncbi:hypothetical protein OIU84_000878 [Salix udensis]|uniref:GH18 domain-containing protein n=1 Tax=Salix udensis TaxID=889485 RepID=A0AAD6PMX0_9ROSI|nr:hypothetical protein OIU84_000878 [Salix udensis]